MMLALVVHEELYFEAVIRDYFNVLTYEEQNQYLARLMIRQMAIKSVR